MNRPPWVAALTRTYDPAFSYVVIENHLEDAGESTGFQKVSDALPALKSEIVDHELVKDPVTGQQRLVIKIKRREAEEIMLAFLGTDLKNRYRCYVY